MIFELFGYGVKMSFGSVDILLCFWYNIGGVEY